MRYGWRARIGHIAPAILDTSAEELRKLLPEGALHVGLTISEPIQTLRAEQAAAAFERMDDAGRRLAREKVDVLICGGAPVALSKGPAGDAELADLLRRETGLLVVMANGVGVEALRYFGARSVVAVSPFIEARNQEIAARSRSLGDSIFMPDGSTARCDFPGRDAKVLYASIRRLYELPASTRVFVCHDYGPGGREPRSETTIGAQRAGNIHLRDGVTEQEFVELRTRRDAGLELPALLYPSVQFNIRGGRPPPAESNRRHYLKLPFSGPGD